MPEQMNVLDLFSGIGGFSLGLERAGMRTVAFCEIEPFCRAVLRERWPGVPIYGDIKELSSQHLTADGICVDVVCGGFPCQDISIVGKNAGIDGERSGLWREYARIIGELRPRYAIVENVAALSFRGLLRVLGDLAEIGYDAEWHCIPAAAVGAPHERERVWIIANPTSAGLEGLWRSNKNSKTNEARPHVAEGHSSSAWSNSYSEFIRLDDGLPNSAHRLRSHGNAVVPQIPEIIGRAIMQSVYR